MVIAIFTINEAWQKMAGKYHFELVNKTLTVDSFLHMISSQPCSGGHSGMNTQSASEAKAATSAKYLQKTQD